MATKKPRPMYQTPFFVKTKHGGAFTDHETNLVVHSHKIAKVDGVIGTQTMMFLRAGGLVIVPDEAVETAHEEDNVMPSDSFSRTTKIKMVLGKDESTGEETLVPTEVPIEPEDDEDEDAEDEDEDAEGEEDDDTDNDAGPSLNDLLANNDDGAPKPKKNKAPKAKNKSTK